MNPPPPPPIDPSFTPNVSIAELSSNAPIEEILKIIDRDGGVILTDFLTGKQLESLNYDVDKARRSSTAHGIPNIPQETVLVNGLVGKSRTAANICESPVITQLLEQILTETYTVKRDGGIVDKHTIDPLLHVSVSLNIGPGAPRQRLHRDDAVHGIDHSAPFHLKKASQFGCLIAGCQTTRENGATMFIPGSHRWDDEREPTVEEICFAVMKPGSALIFLGSAYHGGGHNSVPNFYRMVHGLFFIRGTFRQEENQFLAVPRSVALTMSNRMLSLLGYKKPTTTLGVVEGRDPMLDLQSVLINANA